MILTDGEGRKVLRIDMRWLIGLTVGVAVLAMMYFMRG